jgi:glyoxylate carboligase
VHHRQAPRARLYKEDFQAVDIEAIAKPVTKWAVTVREPRVTNIAMGTEIDNVVEFEQTLDLPLDEVPGGRELLLPV